MAVGLRKPKNLVPGADIAGTVEAVGKKVTTLAPGDEVFGWCVGAFAEYACAPEGQFVPKPAGLTFEQAAAIGVSASTALQLLRDQAKVQPGQKVLINGASGGLGTFAVQIAKAFGAEVTGVCSTGNLDLVRSIGADHPERTDRSREGHTGHRWNLPTESDARGGRSCGGGTCPWDGRRHRPRIGGRHWLTSGAWSAMRPQWGRHEPGPPRGAAGEGRERGWRTNGHTSLPTLPRLCPR